MFVRNSEYNIINVNIYLDLFVLLHGPVHEVDIVWFAEIYVFLDPGHHVGLQKCGVAMDQGDPKLGNCNGLIESLAGIEIVT